MVPPGAFLCLCFAAVQSLSDVRLGDPVGCRTPGFSFLHHLPEFVQTHVHRVNDAIQPSSVVPLSSCLQSFTASGSFPMSWLFASGGPSIGASASASVLPMNIQDESLCLSLLIKNTLASSS